MLCKSTGQLVIMKKPLADEDAKVSPCKDKAPQVLMAKPLVDGLAKGRAPTVSTGHTVAGRCLDSKQPLHHLLPAPHLAHTNIPNNQEPMQMHNILRHIPHLERHPHRQIPTHLGLMACRAPSFSTRAATSRRDSLHTPTASITPGAPTPIACNTQHSQPG